MSFSNKQSGHSPLPLFGSLLLALLLLVGCAVEQGTNGAENPAIEAQRSALADASAVDAAGLGGVYVPDRIAIPSIEVDTPVIDLGWREASDPSGRVFNDWDVAEFAAGWHVNSGKLGQGGNVVLSGHNNTLGSVFRELDQLKAGDIATVWSGDQRFDYRIGKVVIMPERDATHEQRLKNATWIGEFDDDRVTLVSCWPRDDNSHRIIVVGHQIDDAESVASTSNAER